MAAECPSAPDHLFETLDGFSYRCPCCNRIEVVFKHFVVALNEYDFERLRKANDVLLDSVERYGPYSSIDFHVKVEDRTLRIPLFPLDVLDLKELLDGTAAMIELETILAATLS